MGLTQEVCVRHGILPFTQKPCTPARAQTHTRAKLDTKSILQRVLFDNTHGAVEGCHLEKIGFHFREQRTGLG